MKNLFLFIAAVWMAVVGYCQASKSAYYKPAVFEYEGITLPYRQLELNQDAEEPAMIVIQLHGGTARGSDNTAQLAAAAVDSVETYLRAHPSHAFFLLPQCSADRVWNENSAAYDVVMTQVLKAWIDYFAATHDVDLTRIYITGYSAGGSGSWRMVNDYGNFFAAALIAAANPVMITAENVKSTPVFAVAGSEDNIMNANRIQSFVRSLVVLGGEARFDLLEGKDHFGTCDAAFTRERLDWLLRHRRAITGDVNRDGNVNAADVTALYNYILNGDTTFLTSSDVNGDGSINAGDVTAVYNIILGL